MTRPLPGPEAATPSEWLLAMYDARPQAWATDHDVHIARPMFQLIDDHEGDPTTCRYCWQAFKEGDAA